MKRTTVRRTVQGAVAGAVVLTAALAAPLGAGAAQTVRSLCTVDIGYTGDNVVSSYRNTFRVTSATPFFDDRSTALREETLTAAVIDGDIVVDYFKDMNVVDAVRQQVTVTGGRGGAQGEHTFFTSNQGARTTTYRVTCTRL